MTAKPPIPDSILDDLEALARLPLKSEPTKKIAQFFADVAELKGVICAEKKYPSPDWKGHEEAAWRKVRDSLDRAMDERDFRALAEFGDALEKAGEPEFIFRCEVERKDGSRYSSVAYGPPANKPRVPLQVQIVLAIRQIQFLNGRAPTRGEILSLLEKRESVAGANEISRRITKMKLNRVLNTKGDLKSSAPMRCKK